MIELAKLIPGSVNGRAPQPVEPLRSSQTVGDEYRGKSEEPTAQDKTQASQQADQSVTPDDLDRFMDVANDILKTVNMSLKISYREDSARYAVKLVNDETGEVVREFPPEELLEMAARLKEFTERLAKPESPLVGVLVDHRL